MALHRFFAEGAMPSTEADSAEGFVLPLAAADVHHLRDVLRLDSGDEIILAGDGRAVRVKLIAVGERVLGRAAEELEAVRLPRVTLAQGLAKGEKMDDIVRQTTELGVYRIVPFAAERSVVKLEGSKALAREQRWRRVAAEASKQSQRADMPHVSGIVRSAELAEALAGSVVLVCWEEAPDAPGIAAALAEAALRDTDDVAVVVGPEGGLTEREVASLLASGARVCSLGSTILRTETAGVVATALALYARGALGASHA